MVTNIATYEPLQTKILKTKAMYYWGNNSLAFFIDKTCSVLPEY